MLNELGVGGKHFTKTKIRFLFWDENLGATFTTQSWILLAQVPRTDLYIDQVVEFFKCSWISTQVRGFQMLDHF